MSSNRQIEAYGFDSEQNKLFCRHGVGCQSPGNCSKHRRFGGHMTSTEIKRAQRCGSRARSRDFRHNFRFPADQWRRIYILPMDNYRISKSWRIFDDIRVRSKLSTFMKAYREYLLFCNFCHSPPQKKRTIKC